MSLDLNFPMQLQSLRYTLQASLYENVEHSDYGVMLGIPVSLASSLIIVTSNIVLVAECVFKSIINLFKGVFSLDGKTIKMSLKQACLIFYSLFLVVVTPVLVLFEVFSTSIIIAFRPNSYFHWKKEALELYEYNQGLQIRSNQS